MRVREFELRLIAGALSILWALAAALVLVGYRPGGPDDLLVGLAACVPVPIAVAALAWPPTARGDRAFASIVWLGLGAVLLLVPAIGSVLNQLQAGGTQTLLPSLEAAYPWVVALGATSLFSSLGIVRRLLGGAAIRRARLVRAMLLGSLLTASGSVLFAAVAVANDLALQDRPAIASRFGPTDDGPPPVCNDPLEPAPSARVVITIYSDIDGHSTGGVDLAGARSGSDFRWSADVAGSLVLGQVGQARIGSRAWEKGPREQWHQTAAADVFGGLLDRQVFVEALDPASRSAPEEIGLEFVEGARARHCRIAITGATFAAAFPQVRWLVGEPDLHRWRGRLDYWIFVDGEVGKADAAVNGEAASLGTAGLQANLRATMIATDRNRQISIAAPAG